MTLKQAVVLLIFTVASVPAAQSADTLIFSHSAHLGDIGAQCADCHGGILKDKGRPVTEASCKECHDNSTASFECRVCHSDTARPLPWRKAKTELLFSHGKHDARGIACATCHQGIEKTTKGSAIARPAMKLCLTCHDNRKASGSCALCHTDLASIKPADHDAAWLKEGGHGFQSRFSDSECRACHASNWCEQCHQGQTSYKVHTPGFQFMHGQAAKRRDLDCAFCHTRASTCVRCHTGSNK